MPPPRQALDHVSLGCHDDGNQAEKTHPEEFLIAEGIDYRLDDRQEGYGHQGSPQGTRHSGGRRDGNGTAGLPPFGHRISIETGGGILGRPRRIDEYGGKGPAETLGTHDARKHEHGIHGVHAIRKGKSDSHGEYAAETGEKSEDGADKGPREQGNDSHRRQHPIHGYCHHFKFHLRLLLYFFSAIRGLMPLYTSSMSAMLFQKFSGPWEEGL